jgi:hypothetical protein
MFHGRVLFVPRMYSYLFRMYSRMIDIVSATRKASAFLICFGLQTT